MQLRRRMLLMAAVASGTSLACRREPQSVPVLIGNLRHPDAGMRRRAAEGLRMKMGIPAEAIDPLLQAITVERDKKAHGAMLVTLGKSGVPEAKPHIDGALPVPDVAVRRSASDALKHWLIATGQMHPKQKLPKGWPYGLPGFPPPLPAGFDDDD